MGYFTGYQNELQGTHGPFLAPPNGQLGPQVGFLSDLRLFLSGRQEYTAYLKNVSYNSEEDTWSLVFADPVDQSVLVSGTLDRLVSGNPRTSGSIGSGARVAIFSTGPYWTDPSWGGAGSWQQDYLPTAAQVEASRELNGPKTIRRIVIDGQPDPFDGEYPMDGHQTIIGGYNLQLSQEFDQQGTMISPIDPQLSMNGKTIVIAAGYSLGDGAPPTSTESSLNILTINGVQSDSSSNNFKISSKDCIKVTVPPPTQDGEILDNEIQIDSDCGPCCGCENYRNISAAIELSYQKVVNLHNTLALLYNKTYESYTAGIKKINAIRESTPK